MRTYRASRFKQLIFPQELIIDKFHVLSRKRHFPAFWRVREESIPLSKLASIQIHRGFLFSRLLIENSGGPYPIIMDGMWNGKAREARDLLETIEREMQKHRDIAGIVGDADDGYHDRGPNEPPDGSGPPPWWENENNPPKQDRTDDRRNQASNVVPAFPRVERESEFKGLPADEVAMASRHQESMATGTTRENTWKVHNDLPATALYRHGAANAQISVEPVDVTRQSRKIGEIPPGWVPPAPWEPLKIAEKPREIQDPGFREVDPVEFLTSEPETTAVAVAVMENPEPVRRTAVESLVNWWDQTRTELADFKPVPHRRRRRKLN